MTHNAPVDAEMGSGSEVDYGSISDGSMEADPNAAPTGMDWDKEGTIYTALSYKELRSKLEIQVLPSDDRERQCFDIPVWFELGDPNVHYNAPAARSYETSGEMGGPDWHALFFYILDHCAGLQGVSTVFVLVDNRNLASEHTQDATIAHWPAVAAWWKSRVVMTGPTCELSDLLFIPICKASGLERVHPTWAGTFVLAALCLVFPQKHFALLDSDCIPVTLFEVGDLWRGSLLSSSYRAPYIMRYQRLCWEAGVNRDFGGFGQCP